MKNNFWLQVISGYEPGYLGVHGNKHNKMTQNYSFLRKIWKIHQIFPWKHEVEGFPLGIGCQTSNGAILI